MNPIVYAIPVFMLTIVIEALIAWRRRRPLYHVPDAVASLHLGVFSQVAGAFLRVLNLGIYLLVYERFHAFELSAKSPWIYLFALVLYDLAYYFHHRFGHEVNVLWAGHVVHHSSEYFNLSTALRQPSSTTFVSWMFYLPLALIGVPPVVFIVAGLIDLLYQYWVHTELIGRLGVFDRIFVTPSNHRVHHGQNDYCLDCNYGGIFIIWDRIFGTFVEEREGEPVVYGVRKPLRSYNPLWSNLHVYADLWQKMREQKGLRQKIAVWFAPPTGHLAPGEKPPHFEPATFARFDSGADGAVQRYALLQYTVLAGLTTHFIAVASSLPVASRALYALCLLCSMTTVGLLLEGRSLARRIEQGRIVLLGLLFALSPTWFGFVAPLPLKIFGLLLGIGCALWLARMPLFAPPRGALA